MSTARPPINDPRKIIDVVRRRGSVHYRIEDVPGEFVSWRRSLRQAAKAIDLRISVIRASGLVVVVYPDHEESEDERHAMADVIDAVYRGEKLTHEDAVRRRGRQRLTAVNDPQP